MEGPIKVWHFQYFFIAFRISASRCLCASVTVARLYGLSSSVPKPGIHMFQLRSDDHKQNVKQF